MLLKHPRKIQTSNFGRIAVATSSGEGTCNAPLRLIGCLSAPNILGKVLPGIVALFLLLVESVSAEAPSSLVLRSDKGAVVYRLEANDSGGKLVDGQEKEVFRFKRNDEAKRRILNINRGETLLGSIASKHSGKWEIYDQKNVLQFVFKQEEAGYKLKSNDEQSLYRIKGRPYGTEVETADDKSVFKIRLEASAVRFENAQGKLVYSSPASANTLMMSCFGLEKLSLEQKAGLACAVATMR